MKRFFALATALLLILSFSGCAITGTATTIKEDTVFLELDALQNLSVEMTSGTFEIIPVSGDAYLEYSIKTAGTVVGDPAVTVSQSAHRTEIATKGLTVMLGGSIKYELYLYLPCELVDSFDLEMTSGESYLCDMDLRSLYIEMTSGRITGDNLNAEEFELDSTSGTIKLDGAFLDIDVDITSGTVEIGSSVLPERMDLYATSGKINIGIPDDPRGFALEYKRTSGRIRSDFSIAGDISDNRGTVSYEEGYGDYRAELTSGTIEITEY